MGMFDKDKVFAPDGRLDEVYPPGPVDSREGPTFVLWGVEPKGVFEVENQIENNPEMTWLTVSEVLSPEDKKVIGTLSGPIAEKAKQAEATDFPCVVRSILVKTEFNDSNVLQWVREYDDGEPPKKK